MRSERNEGQEYLLRSGILNLDERDLQLGEVEDGLYDGVHFDCCCLLFFGEERQVLYCSGVSLSKETEACSCDCD